MDDRNYVGQDRSYEGEAEQAAVQTLGGGAKAFAAQDERRFQNSVVGQGKHMTEALPLNELCVRMNELVSRLRDGLGGTTAMLNEHADRVTGAAPVAGGHDELAARGTDYSGMLGEAFLVLGVLEATADKMMREVAHAADRNVGLA